MIYFQLVKLGLRNKDHRLPNKQQGELSYIANELSYKLNADISLNKANQLKSNFVEIINSKKQYHFYLAL